MSVSRRNVGKWILGLGLGLAGGARPSLAGDRDNWRSGFSNAPEKLDSVMTRLYGRLPEALAGNLYRNGPAQFERDGERVGHWFDGDGMVQRFQLANGRVKHHGRFVATSKRLAEAAEGRFMYGGYGFAPRKPASFSHPDQINAANTNVLRVGGEIWALWEGGSPWRLDAMSLETIGRQAFPGEANGLIFSAHPKHEAGGDIWNFGGFGSRCVLWRLGSDGSLKSVGPVALPRSTLMHDFAVTKNHIVLLAPPMIEIARPAKSLLDRYDWRGEQPLLAIVVDKNDLSVRRTYELPAHFLYHIGNAWEDSSGTIRLDACLAENDDFATRVARILPAGTFEVPPYAKPTLITLHPDGRSDLSSLEGRGEFPRIDPRRVGSRHRYTYGVTPDGVAQWDWDRGTRQVFRYGERYWPDEPIFVPRPTGWREDDGWVLATRLDMSLGRTELLVFLAGRMEDGPIAAFACPYAIPLGFHGTFVQSS